MALIQHRDEKVRFQQQLENGRNYVLPFIEQAMKIGPETRVLDIGCGDGGVMVPFLERGCFVTGIELDEQKSNYAKSFLSNYIENGKASIINLNIYEEAALTAYKHQFDLILLKDVIEHIPDQEKFIPYLKEFLKPGGRVFFGFPPWYMPHGGHQQICESKFLSMLPYYHLLPSFLYKFVLRIFRESPSTIDCLMEVKSTGISIERFEKLVSNSNYTIEYKTHYLLNPIYQYKFGWKPRVQMNWLSKIPFFRNFLTTCVYYLIRK
ncbi:MAG: class I SAM-dependent methyltransferase [Chitinophagia bacterium]|jgi:SAM-dependent methyltransferase